MSTRARLITAAFCVLIATGSAWAQPLGTFRWQQQPYCNVLTLNVIGEGGNYTLDGTDDLCGATQKASVTGIAYLNPDGRIGFGLTLVTPPAGAPLHINATITLASLGGTWNDSDGNTGNFVFTPGAGTGGSARPASLPANRYLTSAANGNVGVGVTPQSRFHVNGTSWFQGDNTPLPASAGKGIAIGYADSISTGYIFGFDYGTFTPTTLALNSPGGKVGIGTLIPCATLHVIVGSRLDCNPAALTVENDSAFGITVRSTASAITATSTNGTIFEGRNSIFAGGTKFVVTNSGNVLADGTYSGPADFAEMMAVSGSKEDYEPGDVLAIDSEGKLTRTTTPYASNLAGVYSTKPGFVGDTEITERGVSGFDIRPTIDRVPLALLGIVPTKVSAENGAISPGDLLTTSGTPGHAMKCADKFQCFGATLGKALERLAFGNGVIKVLVTLR
jgi:hypothetical protein